MIALTVSEEEDWKDVQIPARKKAMESKEEVKPEASSVDQPLVVGEHHFEHVPNVGPATNLLLAQYGLKAR